MLDDGRHHVIAVAQCSVQRQIEGVGAIERENNPTGIDSANQAGAGSSSLQPGNGAAVNLLQHRLVAERVQPLVGAHTPVEQACLGHQFTSYVCQRRLRSSKKSLSSGSRSIKRRA